MTYPRSFANGIVLPNGQVLIVGGQSVRISSSYYPLNFLENTTNNVHQSPRSGKGLTPNSHPTEPPPLLRRHRTDDPRALDALNPEMDHRGTNEHAPKLPLHRSPPSRRNRPIWRYVSLPPFPTSHRCPAPFLPLSKSLY